MLKLKKIISHLKTYVFRGILAVIPVALTVFAIGFLYHTIDKRVTGIVDNFFGFAFPGLGIIIVLIILYLIGLGVSNVIGKQILGTAEKITGRIPLIKTTYKVGKQLSTTLSLPEREIFKRAVLVEYLRPGIWTIGFVTGHIIDNKNPDEKYLKVFVPTPPNPASGTMVIVKESETRDPGWTIDEALQSVISGGIIGPDELR